MDLKKYNKKIKKREGGCCIVILNISGPFNRLTCLRPRAVVLVSDFMTGFVVVDVCICFCFLVQSKYICIG